MAVMIRAVTGVRVLVFVLLMSPASAATAIDSSPEGFAALVADVSGGGAVTRAGKQPHTVGLYDALEPGVEIVVPSDVRITLVFASGRRVEVSGPAKARVARDGVSSSSGNIRDLPWLPRLPRVPAIASSDSGKVAAIRLRASAIPWLYPSVGATTRADETTLEFARAAGAGPYKVQVDDRDGVSVFKAETDVSQVSVPAGVLKSASLYYWTVRASGPGGGSAQASFRTLSAGDERARERFKAAIEETNDARALGVLAELDRRLGLIAEARKELQAAVRAAPEDAALRSALARLEAQINRGKT
jgi:hypothetical protein